MVSQETRLRGKWTHTIGNYTIFGSGATDDEYQNTNKQSVNRGNMEYGVALAIRLRKGDKVLIYPSPEKGSPKSATEYEKGDLHIKFN